MTKKNPYKFTISFNENNPQHLQAATMLNQYSRGEKADYLARAIAAYEGMEGTGGTAIDANLMKQMIRQILSEERQEKKEATEHIQDLSQRMELELPSSTLLKNISKNMSAFRR